VSRRILFLSMSIETLLEVLSGRATAKLPADIPPDSTLLYSYIEHDSQTLKIAITHPSFESISGSGYIKTHSIETKLVPGIEKPKSFEGYSEDSLIASEEWSRLV
jgi:hypothetical protein